jgi:hypothetical protein
LASGASLLIAAGYFFVFSTGASFIGLESIAVEGSDFVALGIELLGFGAFLRGRERRGVPPDLGDGNSEQTHHPRTERTV